MTGKLYASKDACTVWWGADGKGHTMYLASGLPNAATALNYRLTLVTTDSDFTRVPYLSFMHIPLNALKG